MGTATGAITVATGIFVMPGTPYIQSMEFDRDRLVRALGLSFTVSTVTLAAALAYTGHVRKHRLPGLQLWRLPQRLSAWGWDNSRAAKSRPKPSGCVSLSG